MIGAAGEMPFLDHLEELRTRLLKSVSAVVGGFAVGLWIVQRLDLIVWLKRPIAPYLAYTGGKLVITSPTDTVMIVLKLSFVVGLVLASPVISYQAWAFLSPALYARERRTVMPALLVGLLLFLLGAVLGWLFVVPQALAVFFGVQSEALAYVITYNEYFSFVIQIILALGISFELPLLIIILAALGIVTPAVLNRFRRYAIVLSCIAGALLSPGADVISMIMMTIPLLLLYEVGFAGAVLIHRRRLRREAAAAAVFLALLLGAGPLQGQQPVPPQKPGRGLPAQPAQPAARLPGDSLRDTTRIRPGQSIDTATARRLGLPSAPARPFAAPDSVMQELVKRQGYEPTRYQADSATLLAEEKRILLSGQAMTERRGSTLEANSINYQESTCLLRAVGLPHLFDKGSVLAGESIRYDTCERRGVVENALTNFQQGSTTWLLRGDLAQDSSSSRLFAASSGITSCNLPVPHYHFQAREVKWISKSVLVARPAVLYVRDVPILWLPFVFQDAREGRHSGILIPQFGLNDIVRPNESYNRQITNIGYYFVPNDYLDLTARLDWYANRYTQWGVSTQYRWLDRFVSGTAAYSRQLESSGASSTAIRWDHRQSFNLTTSLNLNLNYVSNSSVVNRNAIDPVLTTQQISSALNFSKQYRWGTIAIGGNRRQSLTDNSVSQTLPTLTISPKPLDLTRSITWSPAFSLTNSTTSGVPQSGLVLAGPNGSVDTLVRTYGTRTTSLSFDTPLRFGGFNWRNSFRVTDQQTSQSDVVRFTAPDPTSPNPTDSVTVSRIYQGNFSTGIDWDTGINLPTLFRGSWKLQPGVGVTNVTSGPFLLRNRNTNGGYVRQSKRFALNLSVSPTLFGFWPGFGPIGRIRHSFAPTVSYTFSPGADVPAEYARAITVPGQVPQLRSDPAQVITFGMTNNFEGKARPTAADTGDQTNLRKFRLLSIATSSIQYDFEQAKKPGHTGWRTQTITNAFQTDMIPGFNLTLDHDLWKGTVGTDTAKFSPFLQRVTASFGVSGSTIRSIGVLLGLAHRDSTHTVGSTAPPQNYVADIRQRSLPGDFNNANQPELRRGSSHFSANFNYSLSRSRPGLGVAQPSLQSLGFSTSFSPTTFWTASWSAQFNITDGKFESQIVRLERDLHEWKAGFNFVRNANGNFAFYFTIFLTDLPELKFDYNQTTIQQ